MKHKLRMTTILLAITISFTIMYFYSMSHNKTNDIFIEQTKINVLRLKKDFLKDTVNNVIFQIDRLRKTKYAYYKNLTKDKQNEFQYILEGQEEDIVELFNKLIYEDKNKHVWTSILWDNNSGEILFKSKDIGFEDMDNIHNMLNSMLIDYVTVKRDNIEGIIGVSYAFVEKQVKEEIGNLIRDYKFSNDSYIWVNEVIDYSGGENYAIRRIHPNLRDTEGTYLSTDIKDIKGNFPYLMELEGVKNGGEAFYNYYFKELNSSDISEKITYAKLYKDYNWIIAMGVHTNDIDEYIGQVNDEIASLSKEAIVVSLKSISLAFAVGLILIYLVEKKYIKISTNSLEKEINLDLLTNAHSRRFGEKALIKFINDYWTGGESPAIMMMDFDDFKWINDKYGHNAGDIVLIEIVNRINKTIRSSDILIRWGGDEFLGVFPGLGEEYVIEFGNKLLEEISSLEIDLGNKRVNLTASIGFSYFKDEDKDYNDVVKRADQALYLSKSQGKNRVNKM